MSFYLKTPCGNCPFLRSRPVPLKPERVEEIHDSLMRGEFYCHKTVDYGSWEDEGGEEQSYVAHGEERHCAGALILMEKEGELFQSQMVRIAHRLGLFNPDELNMDAPVFDDWDEMIEAMERK